MEFPIDNIAKLRLVARLGEMDRLRWWNTKGTLGNLGKMAISRGFPKNARLRSVPIKLNGETAQDAIELLAAAHSCSESGKLAVPFIREEDFPK